MAYRIPGVTKQPEEWGTLLTGMLGCYDTITDPDYEYDRDETLHERSACELIREQLTEAQRAELDQIDAFWKAHPEAFNQAFAVFHHQEDKAVALAGFIEDQRGDVPPVPRSHWWWRPVEV